MKYSLRSLMFVALVLSPLLAGAYFVLQSLSEKVTDMAFATVVFVVAVVALSAFWILLLNRL
ncbi:MAG: hypothetical protein K8R36_04995 [Planctomycetales bacterium]|nr:hypothetical protein [Planctomycetales bacterium]